ncbi:MAG: site-specific integrase [Candidatus Eisenbacteria bacterium]
MTEERKADPKAESKKPARRGLGSAYRQKRVIDGERVECGPWWVKFYHRGKAHRESSHSMKEADAVRLLKRRLGEMGAGRFVPDADKVAFDDLAAMIVADYEANGRRSLPGLKNSIEHLRAAFGGMAAVAITTDRLTRYVRDRQKEKPPAANATVRKELMALHRAFTLAVRAGRLMHAPAFPTISVSNVRQGFFEDGELEAVLAHLAPQYTAVVLFLAWTGWRRGEALGLRWRDVDFKAGTARLEPGTTKNDEGRTYPFAAHPALADLLRRQRESASRIERERGRIVNAVFHGPDGRAIADFHDAWEEARKEAGLPGRLIHDLRRTAVRNLERAGVSRSVAMKLTGHKTESVYRRYAIVSEADLGEGVGKLAALHASSGSIRAAFPPEAAPKAGSADGGNT